MKLQFMFLGKKNPVYSQHIFTKYVNRLRKYIKIELFFLNAQNEKKLEQRIFIKHTLKTYCIVLDEKGKQMKTIEYANFINKTLFY